jgi:hypothetical protein
VSSASITFLKKEYIRSLDATAKHDQSKQSAMKAIRLGCVLSLTILQGS